jgi:hypothetical protein
LIVHAARLRKPDKLISPELSAPSQITDNVAAAETRRSAFATALTFTPSPSAAIETLVSAPTKADGEPRDEPTLRRPAGLVAVADRHAGRNVVL